MNMDTLSEKQRLIGLDIFRVVSAAMILMFHSAIHVECYYGVFHPFVMMGAVFMTAFFILSGFSLYYGYQEKTFSNISCIWQFYKKRAIGILPVYYVVAILYILFLGEESVIQNIALAPIEMLGIQTVFSSLFEYTHNGGTWFISCILFCYLVFPFIQMCMKQLKTKRKLQLGGGECTDFIICPFDSENVLFIHNLF